MTKPELEEAAAPVGGKGPEPAAAAGEKGPEPAAAAGEKGAAPAEPAAAVPAGERDAMPAEPAPAAPAEPAAAPVELAAAPALASTDPAASPTDAVSKFAHELLVHEDGKFALGLRIYGWWLTVSGWVTLLAFGLAGGALAAYYLLDGPFDIKLSDYIDSNLALILTAVSTVAAIVECVLMLKLGRSLRKSVHRRAAVWSRWLVWLEAISLSLSFMLSGFSTTALLSFVEIIALIIFSTALDPALIAERRGKRAHDQAVDRAAAAHGMLGRDLSGKGFMRVDFFNVFWMFFTCSILGLLLEIVWHVTVVDPGVYQDRAGLLVGPFSPIYGFGAVLVSLALNRLYDKSPVITFVVAGLVGGGFEWATAVFMRTSFGITAWDYSSYTLFGLCPDPVAGLTGGDTSTFFLAMWGVLGLVWVKLILPVILRGINAIPWRLRYGATAVFAALMIADGLLTLGSLDCWFERTSGVQPSTPIEWFFAEYCGDDFMANRFQSMTIDTSDSTRGDTAARAVSAAA